jgi:hypothetical protein
MKGVRLGIIMIGGVLCMLALAGTAAATGSWGEALSSMKETDIGPIKVILGANERLRYEYREDFDFDEDRADNDGLWYNRLKLNLKAVFTDQVSFFFEGFDCREWDSDASPNTQEDNFDMHQGYLLLQKLWCQPLALTIGRQELQYGAKRLVAAPSWSNNVRSFDAVKLGFSPAWADIDFFVANRVVYKDNEFNDAYWGENFFGAYLVCKRFPGQVFDLYALSLVDNKHEVRAEDRTLGDYRRHTLGTRGEGKVPPSGLGYGYEFAFQCGQKASDDIRAYAYHLDVNYLFKNVRFQPAVRLEYEYASGDDDPNDGDSETFDPLFQTTHDPYGTIDFFRWQNVRHLGLILDATPLPSVKASLQYHRFYLADSDDAWYNSSGKVLRRDRSGRADDYVGDELDAVLKYDLNKYVSFESGYAHFFAGEYVEDTGSSNDADWFYLQTTLNF